MPFLKHAKGLHQSIGWRQGYPRLVICLRTMLGTDMAKQSIPEVTRRLAGTL